MMEATAVRNRVQMSESWVEWPTMLAHEDVQRAELLEARAEESAARIEANARSHGEHEARAAWMSAEEARAMESVAARWWRFEGGAEGGGGDGVEVDGGGIRGADGLGCGMDVSSASPLTSPQWSSLLSNTSSHGKDVCGSGRFEARRAIASFWNATRYSVRFLQWLPRPWLSLLAAWGIPHGYATGSALWFASAMWPSSFLLAGP